jgi:glutaredoxin
MTTCVVYWQPGCTSCLNAKEFLRAHGIPFESVNVRENAGARDELARLGAKAVPVIVRDGRFVLGQDLEEVARFLGVALQRSRLPAAVLARRIVDLLDAAAGYARAIPADALADRLPGRNRTYLDLAFHIPMIVTGLLDAAQGGCLTFEHFNRKPPERIGDGRQAAVATQQVARAFVQWWSANADSLPGDVDTYYGRQPLLAVLERTAWHVAQHVRQLEHVLRRLGVPCATLPEALLDGLPLPADVWDAEVPFT